MSFKKGKNMNIRRQILLTLVALNAGLMIHAAPLIYVGDSGDHFVYVIDAATNEVVTSISIGTCNESWACNNSR